MHTLQTMAMAAAGSEMLELSEISAGGERAGAMDRLNGKGMTIGSNAFPHRARGRTRFQRLRAAMGRQLL